MLSRERNLAAIIVLAVIMLASILLSAGCDMIKFTDDSSKQNGTNGSSSNTTSDKTPTRPDSQNSSPSANRVQGDYSWPNGDKYHGQLLNGLPDGTGTLIIWNVAWDSDWNCYIGEWKAGKINGYGKMELGTDGSYYEGNFKDNLPNGEGELFDPFNGKEPKAGKWTTAKKNGQWYSTSDNGLSFYPLVPGE